MSDVAAKFEIAVRESTELAQRPDDDNLLKLYALYKQATEGDVSGERPSFADFVGAAKHDAWEKIKGLSAHEAMQKYVDLIGKLEIKEPSE